MPISSADAESGPAWADPETTAGAAGSSADGGCRPCSPPTACCRACGETASRSRLESSSAGAGCYPEPSCSWDESRRAAPAPGKCRHCGQYSTQVCMRASLPPWLNPTRDSQKRGSAVDKRSCVLGIGPRKVIRTTLRLRCCGREQSGPRPRKLWVRCSFPVISATRASRRRSAEIDLNVYCSFVGPPWVNRLAYELG